MPGMLFGFHVNQYPAVHSVTIFNNHPLSGLELSNFGPKSFGVCKLIIDLNLGLGLGFS